MIKIVPPFKNYKEYPISQGFGANPEVYRRFGLPAHNGLDFACQENTQVVACADGNVVRSELHNAYGNIVKIKHSGGYFSLYAHLNKRVVNVGEIVKQGEIIGLSGSTGYSTGPHLHFGLQSITEGTQPYNYYTDPVPYFSDSKKKSINKETLEKPKKNEVIFMSSTETDIKTKTKKEPIKEKHIFTENINIGSRDAEVIELQKRLKEEGFFTYPRFTEYYGPVTRKAVLDYQLAKGVVSSPYDTGAGRLGPGTRSKLNE